MMDRQPTTTSPMSVATEPPARLSEDVSSDVVATRHLRLILESITADKNLSEEERKRKISNFGAALMASAETKAPIEKKPEIQTRTSATTVYSPQSKDDIMKMELVKAVLLANAEKSKIPPPLNERKEPQTTATTAIASSAAISLPQQPKPATVPKPEMQTHSSVSKPELQTYSSTASFTSSPVPKPEMQTYSSVPKPEMQTYSSTASFTTSSPSRKPNDKPEFNRATSAASVTSGASISLPQPKSNTKKKKGWLFRKLTGKKNRDEVRVDFDHRDYSGRNSDRDPAEDYSFSEVGSNEVADESPMYGIQEEPYDGVIRGTGSNISAHSDESDRSIGTFEQDYINDIIRDQMKEKHLEEFEGVLSEGTFEQDARALSALSEGTFEQDARALEAEHTSAVFVPRELGVRQELGVEPNLSETTFEQDAMRDGDDRNDEKIGTAESDLSDGSFGSETTFERDMRKKTTRRTADAPTTEIFEAPSLESVTTFEKEARGREAVASRSRSFGPQMDDYSEEEEASECSDTFMQDVVAQEMRPTQPAPQPVWETTAAPGPVPKISELQVQLSPANISKGSIGKRFFSKFTCHCA